MIPFKDPQISDKNWIDAILSGTGERGCDYSFTNIFTWSRAYHQQVARLGDRLLIRLHGLAGLTYLWPVGKGDIAPAVTALRQDAAEQGEPFRMACLTEAHTALLEAAFPGEFLWEPDRDGFDYLYDINRLADLGGKKLHAKRNHINRFMDANPSWVCEAVTPENLPACMAMDEEWYRRSREREGAAEEEDLGNEGLALRSAMEHFEDLGLTGRLIRVYGEVVAFALGDPLGDDTFDIHFEKAYGELQGAYAMINREFAAWIRENYPHVKYLNREDDMGVEGLRKAKGSYYPDQMVEKQIAIERRTSLAPKT